MTEVLSSSSDSRLLGFNGSFNFLTGGSSGPERESVHLLRWTVLPTEDDRRTRSNSFILSNKRNTNTQKSSAGLKNLGNTCFMNSILQCLSHTRPFFDYCFSGVYKDDINPSSSMHGSLISAFARLTELLRNGENLVSPAEFKAQIDRFAHQYVGHSQQDAQEFLICLLEGLHEDINRVRPGPVSTTVFREEITTEENRQQQRLPQLPQAESGHSSLSSEEWKKCLPKSCNSLITDLFVGVLHSTLKCEVCQHVSNCLDPFIDLSLPLDRSSATASPSSTKGFPLFGGADEVSLLDCLRLLVQNETLDADNKPECEKCKQKQRCTKSFSIDRFPPILILHLKRFSHSGNALMKLTTNVNCPLQKLDLTRFATDTSNTSAVYNLFAVCNHIGSPTNGHYTACARHLETDAWYCFDDARVSKIDSSKVVTSDTYILFYELSETTSSRL